MLSKFVNKFFKTGAYAIADSDNGNHSRVQDI